MWKHCKRNGVSVREAKSGDRRIELYLNLKGIYIGNRFLNDAFVGFTEHNVFFDEAIEQENLFLMEEITG